MLNEAWILTASIPAYMALTLSICALRVASRLTSIYEGHRFEVASGGSILPRRPGPAISSAWPAWQNLYAVLCESCSL